VPAAHAGGCMPGCWLPERPAGVAESSAYLRCRSLRMPTRPCSAACMGATRLARSRQGAMLLWNLREGLMVAAEAEEAIGEGVAEGKRTVERLPGAYLPVSSSGGSAHTHPSPQAQAMRVCAPALQ
jgi:hypothetical protein